MMPLSVIWQVDRRLTADWTNPIASEIAAPWEPDKPPVFLRSSANFVFALRRRGDLCFLRFRPVDLPGQADLALELAFMKACRADGITVPEPVRTVDGAMIHSTEVAGLRLEAVASSELPGVERDATQLDATAATRWGRLLARVHRAGRTVQPRDVSPADLGRMAKAVSGSAPLEAELAAIRAGTATWPTDGRYIGMIHGDPELDNLTWNGLDPAILDFGSCGVGWFALDVARVARELQAERPELIADFMHGYVADGGASFAQDQLELARRWVELDVQGRVRQALDLEPSADHPSWLRDLHARLRGGLQAYIGRLASEHGTEPVPSTGTGS